MSNELVLLWVEAQVQTIVSALSSKHLNPSGDATFQLVPDWGSAAEREQAFVLVAERLRAQGYVVVQSGPSLIVTKT